MARREHRRMKVYYQYGYKDEPVPTIRLKGNWLRDFGFEPGDVIDVECGEGFLVILKVQDGQEEDAPLGYNY